RTRQAAVLPGIRGNSCFTNGWGTAAGGRRARAGNGPRARLAGAILSPTGGYRAKQGIPPRPSRPGFLYFGRRAGPGAPLDATFSDRPDRIPAAPGTAGLRPVPGAGGGADRRPGPEPAARAGRPGQPGPGRLPGRRLP